MRPGTVFGLIWIGWAISWALAAIWSAPTVKRASSWQQFIGRLTLVVGGVLLFHGTGQALGARKLWHVGYHGAYALAGVTLLGILFAWWGRLYLGPLWSGTITRKEGHRVVDTGPYRLVRHPIYTGLILATLATAIAKANWTGIAAFLVVAGGLWFKARAEERFLSDELGAENYAAYRRGVPMLVPFLK